MPQHFFDARYLTYLSKFFAPIHTLRQDKILFLMMTYATIEPLNTFSQARRANDLYYTKHIS